jgi:hypothetical protein
MKQSTKTDDDTREYWTEPFTAHWLGLARITAQTRRLSGKDWPPAYRFGRRVMYRASEVKAWAEAKRIVKVQP